MGTRPLLYAPLAYPFFLLSVAQSCIRLCCKLLKVVTMSQLRKITSFLIFILRRGERIYIIQMVRDFAPYPLWDTEIGWN